MNPLRALPSWRGWAGLVGAPIAWGLHHQAGAYLNFWDCGRGQGGPIALLGAACLAVTVGLGLISYGAWRGAGGGEANTEAPSGRFIPLLSVMTCGLFALTLLLQIGASLILPSCFR
jgi:hypothetical protein